MDMWKLVNSFLNVLAYFESKDTLKRRFDNGKPMPRLLTPKRFNTSTLKHPNREYLKHLLAFSIKT